MINSVTSGPSSRQSNFELLRILAMFFVLTVHADFNALGIPIRDEISAEPFSTFMRVFIEFTAIVSVNLFVLISGWFGIRPTMRGGLKFLFQAIFFAVGIYAVCCIFGITDFSLNQIWKKCVVVWACDQWFVTSYLILYLLAPVLNSYCREASEKSLRNILVGFYVIQTVSSIFFDTEQFYRGYSAISFVGLYLLGQWLRRFDVKKISLGLVWLLILAPIVIDSVVCYYCRMNGISNVTVALMSYTNPLVVAQSAGFILLFARMHRFTSKPLNWFSSGVFGVYLMNCNPVIYFYFCQRVLRIYASMSHFSAFFIILLYLLGFMALSVVIDKLIREPLWNYLSKPFLTKNDG